MFAAACVKKSLCTSSKERQVAVFPERLWCWQVTGSLSHLEIWESNIQSDNTKNTVKGHYFYSSLWEWETRLCLLRFCSGWSSLCSVPTQMDLPTQQGTPISETNPIKVFLYPLPARRVSCTVTQIWRTYTAKESHIFKNRRKKTQQSRIRYQTQPWEMTRFENICI